MAAAWPVEATREYVGPEHACQYSSDVRTRQQSGRSMLVEWYDGDYTIGAQAVVFLGRYQEPWCRIFGTIAEAEEWADALCYEYAYGALLAEVGR